MYKKGSLLQCNLAKKDLTKEFYYCGNIYNKDKEIIGVRFYNGYDFLDISYQQNWTALGRKGEVTKEFIAESVDKFSNARFSPFSYAMDGINSQVYIYPTKSYDQKDIIVNENFMTNDEGYVSVKYPFGCFRSPIEDGLVDLVDMVSRLIYETNMIQQFSIISVPVFNINSNNIYVELHSILKTDVDKINMALNAWLSYKNVNYFYHEVSRNDTEDSAYAKIILIIYDSADFYIPDSIPENNLNFKRVSFKNNCYLTGEGVNNETYFLGGRYFQGEYSVNNLPVIDDNLLHLYKTQIFCRYIKEQTRCLKAFVAYSNCVNEEIVDYAKKVFNEFCLPRMQLLDDVVTGQMVIPMISCRGKYKYGKKFEIDKNLFGDEKLLVDTLRDFWYEILKMNDIEGSFKYYSGIVELDIEIPLIDKLCL